ncbi:MAG: hypothetical protein KF802_12535 [Bdellovibrionaceae bacterium]|nr:hypothetical protein [Pseudobdellovibrionaceae bacterium]MBX3034692.1 hypothetical protein [Pseudobdellovibrionaceae bacterium]
MLSLKTHNILDYVAGVFLIICPWLFGFSFMSTPTNVFLFAGIALIAYSLFTNYQYAWMRKIPIGVHMILDLCLGALLIIAPWAMNYRMSLTSGQEYLHYILGLGLFGFVAVTRVHKEADKRPEDRVQYRPATSRP